MIGVLMKSSGEMYEREVMNLYQTLSRMNTATLEEVIRSVKWEFWFRGDNGFIFYYSAGLF